MSDLQEMKHKAYISCLNLVGAYMEFDLYRNAILKLTDGLNDYELDVVNGYEKCNDDYLKDIKRKLCELRNSKIDHIFNTYNKSYEEAVRTYEDWYENGTRIDQNLTDEEREEIRAFYLEPYKGIDELEEISSKIESFGWKDKLQTLYTL